MMSYQRRQFGVAKTFGLSGNNSLNSNNVGRKMLEKMGWESGLGLGKDNQGMLESPLWKAKRQESDKRGFKSKEEMAMKETLAHQSAFEKLLGELNAECETAVENDKTFQHKFVEKIQTPNRKLRYTKMARAKDISNYTIKDFKGIIGKDVTKKNLSLLCADDDVSLTETIVYNNSLKFTNSSVFCNDKQSVGSTDKYNCVQSKHQLNLLKKDVTVIDKGLTAYSQEQIMNHCQEELQKEKYHSVSETNLISNLEVLVNFKKSSEHHSSVNCDMNFKKSKYEEEEKMKKKKKKRENNKKANEVHVNYHSSHSETNENGNCGLKTNDTFSNLKSKRNAHEQKDWNYRSIDGNSDILHDSPDTKIEASILSKKKRKSNTPNSDASETSNNNGDNECNRISLFSDSSQSSNYFSLHDERILSNELAKDPEVLSQICASFVGSNLHTVKGYGNW